MPLAVVLLEKTNTRNEMHPYLLEAANQARIDDFRRYADEHRVPSDASVENYDLGGPLSSFSRRLAAASTVLRPLFARS